MPLYIMYFNLKDGVSEEEFVKKTKEFLDSGKVEGIGSAKLYRHHLFGANRRVYQMHLEFEDFGAWDRFSTFLEKNAKAAQLMKEWHNLMDYKTHYDEFVREIPL